jgi:hypothetical protein
MRRCPSSSRGAHHPGRYPPPLDDLPFAYALAMDGTRPAYMAWRERSGLESRATSRMARAS